MTETTPHGNDRRHVDQELAGQLVTLGVSRTKAIELVTRFSRYKIEDQINWLAYRAAKTPASLLIAAIENDYEAPTLWQAQQNPKP